MNKVNGIDAILFDLMGVLLFQKNNYRSDPLVDEIDGLIGRVTDDNIFKQEILKKFSLNESDFDKILTKIVDKYEPFQQLWDLLPELRKYYKLAVVNNGTALTFSQFDWRLNFDKYFDLFISSAKEGMKKPDNEIFLTATKQLDVAPKKCLFMDDSEENIKGAKQADMQTMLWLNREDGFRRFIKLIDA